MSREYWTLFISNCTSIWVSRIICVGNHSSVGMWINSKVVSKKVKVITRPRYWTVLFFRWRCRKEIMYVVDNICVHQLNIINNWCNNWFGTSNRLNLNVKKCWVVSHALISYPITVDYKLNDISLERNTYIHTLKFWKTTELENVIQRLWGYIVSWSMHSKLRAALVWYPFAINFQSFPIEIIYIRLSSV